METGRAEHPPRARAARARRAATSEAHEAEDARKASVKSPETAQTRASMIEISMMCNLLVRSTYCIFCGST